MPLPSLTPSVPSAPWPPRPSLGLTLPSPAYLAGMILFSVIGYAAWRYGRRSGRPRSRWIGLGLMLFPYVAPRTWALYLIGTALCGALWLDRG